MKGNGMTTVEQLQERLDELALAVLDGQPGSRESYAATLAEITRLRGEQDLQERAEKQRAVREEAERQAQAEVRRQELERRFAALDDRLRELAPAVDQAAAALVRSAQEFLLAADEQYQVALAMGQNRARLRRGGMVANAILWQLSQLPQIAEVVSRVDPFYRRRLAVILGEGSEASA